jgi:tetratricopeptide (TPR) repeat protein
MKSAAALFLAAALSVFGSARRSARQGEKDFRAGKLPSAEKAFSEAAGKEPAEPLWKFDTGSVKAAEKKNDEARADLLHASKASDAKVAAGAHYQLGTIDLSQERYAEAVRNFRRSLELDPAKADAKRNLEIALRLASQPPPKRSPQENPKPEQGSGNPPPAADREFEKKAGMTRAEAEAMLRSLDDEQKKKEKALERVTAKDW